MRTYKVFYEGIRADIKEVNVTCREINTVYRHIKKEIPDLRKIVSVERISFNNSIDLSKHE